MQVGQEHHRGSSSSSQAYAEGEGIYAHLSAHGNTDPAHPVVDNSTTSRGVRGILSAFVTKAKSFFTN